MNNIKTQRLPLLDSFRCLAILSVLFFHFTYRYINEGVYPYKDFFGSMFRYGGNGVNFFFIISGFVISFTLENTASKTDFFKNRFIRLFPPMLLCSLITFSFFLLFDKNNVIPEAHSTGNFLLSLTFVPPYIWGKLLHLPLNWLNGSYWSLWVEIQFYVVACLFFFSNRQRYFYNMILTAVILSGLSLMALVIYYPGSHIGNISMHTKGELKFWVHDVFSLGYKMHYFAAGICFFRLYSRQPVSGWFTRALVAAVVVLCFVNCRSVADVVIHIAMLLLFWVLVYKPAIAGWLQHPWLLRIGVLSYTIYLIHESIGVFLLKQYGALLGAWSPAEPFILLGVYILFAELSYRLYEMPVIRVLKKRLFESKVHPAPAEAVQTHTADSTGVAADPIAIAQTATVI